MNYVEKKWNSEKFNVINVLKSGFAIINNLNETKHVSNSKLNLKKLESIAREPKKS